MYAHIIEIILIRKSKYVTRLKKLNFKEIRNNLCSTQHRLSSYIIT